jgi:hypothetical protein
MPVLEKNLLDRHHGCRLKALGLPSFNGGAALFRGQDKDRASASVQIQWEGNTDRDKAAR